MNANSLSSLSGNDRIISLDVLRGFAVLGILIMNIQSLSMISAAYMNPMAFGDMTGINKWVWTLSHIMASGKFMAIFSILFGAGLILFTERAVTKGRRAAPLHYRRMMWLLIFGLIHAWCLWYGDILVNYALCGMVLFLFRRKSVKTLLIWSGCILLIPFLLHLMSGWSIPHWPEESYQENLTGWLPTQELIDIELANMQGSWLQQMDSRGPMAMFMQTFLFFYSSGWRALGLMLLGMALYKAGVLSMKRSKAYYLRMTLIGFLAGFPLVIFGVMEHFDHNFRYDYSMFFGSNYNYWGSIGVALGYIGLVLLIVKSEMWKNCQLWFASVGRMALTNYILMSVFGFFLFTGSGFGLYGQVERKIQILIVIAIWIFLLVFSKLWLSKFRFGPLEWLWRRLTYWNW